MKGKRYWEIGGFIAGGVLIVFGVVAIFLGANGYTTTRDAIKDEGITFGTADDPAVAKYASQWAGEQVTTGDQARAFAKIMREHTLEGSGGLTYAQMGRFQSAASPTIQPARATRPPPRRTRAASPSRTAPATSGSPRRH